MNFVQKLIVNFSGKIFGAIMSLLISVLIARVLGADGIGRYQLLLTTQTISITLLAMGFGDATIFFVKNLKKSKKQILSQAFIIYLLISLIYSFIFFYFLFFNKSYFGEYNVYFLLIFVIGSGALLMYNVLLPSLFIELQVIKVQLLLFLSSFLNVLGLIFLLLTNNFDINYILGIIGIVNFIVFVILFLFIRKDINIFINLDYTLIKKIFFYGIKISATNLAYILSSNIVVFLIKYYDQNNFENIGIYSRATAIFNIFILLPASLGPLIYSKWSSSNLLDIRKQIEITFRFMTFCSFLIFVFIALFGKQIIVFLYGSEFVTATRPLMILSFGIIFSSLTIILSNLMASIGKAVLILRSYTISLLLTVCTAILLIPKFELIGAASSVLLGIIFNFLYLYIIAKKIVSLRIKESFVITFTDFYFLKKGLKI